MGNVCANERQKKPKMKDWDPNDDKMKKRVRAMRRALASALLEGENDDARRKQNDKYRNETRNSILGMSAGTVEDDFSRTSIEVRGKRRQRMLNNRDLGMELSVKEDDDDEANENDEGSFLNPNAYDARSTYGTQPNSPRKVIKIFEPNVNHVLRSQKIEKKKNNGRRVSWGGEETKYIDEDLVDDALNHDEDALPPPGTIDI